MLEDEISDDGNIQPLVISWNDDTVLASASRVFGF